MQSFVSLVSHELRTPIHHIKGFAWSLLQEDAGWDDQTIKDSIKTIDEEADRLARLVDDLLYMSRLESSQYHAIPQQEAIAVKDLIEAALSHAAAWLQERWVVIHCADSLGALGDAQQLERVLVNLLENAAKYTPKGTEIEVTAQRQDDSVILAVADQGSGIPPEQREQVFERFVQLQSGGRQPPGTGLGLTICKIITEQHGERIWVEGNEGKGAIFKFTLPAG